VCALSEQEMRVTSIGSDLGYGAIPAERRGERDWNAVHHWKVFEETQREGEY